MWLGGGGRGVRCGCEPSGCVLNEEVSYQGFRDRVGAGWVVGYVSYDGSV